MKPRPRAFQEPHVAVCVDKSRSYGRGVLQGIADYLETMGPWSMYVDHYAVSQLTPNWIRRWRGDAILAYATDESIARRLLKSKIAVVDVAGLVRMPELPRVIADDRAIGRLAAEHFLQRRMRHFAYVGPGDVLPDNLRYDGFATGVADPNCPRYVHPRSSAQRLSRWEEHQERLACWLRQLPKPIGVMGYSDIQAREVLDACSRAGIDVPVAAAVVGVDNDEELCRLSRVPLSSVAGNPRRIGFEAAGLISRMISGETADGVAQHVTVPPLYVVRRRSSDVTAVDDIHVARALSFIQRNATQNIDVSDVVRAAGLPRRSLYRRFAETIGSTPHNELLKARFERVQQLLAETELSIADIAKVCGFDAAYLATCFKREYGQTPGAFRESHQGRRTGR